MEIIKDIATIVGCVSAILALVVACSERIRTRIKKTFSKHTEKIIQKNDKQDSEIKEIKELLKELKQQLNILTDSSKDIMRQRIMDIYHRYKSERILPLYAREALDELYKDYKKENGNSYIDKYYKRMCSWETVYTKDDDLS